MAYVKVTNGAVDQYPYTIGQLRRDNPNTSFPKVIDEATLNSFGVYSVVLASDPSFTEGTQRIQRASTPTLVDNAWTITKSIVDLTDDEITANTESIAMVERETRDDLLKSDVDPINAVRWNAMTAEQQTAWTTYRQALLDVPQQAGFPNTITWPTKPE
jgi:hypothetical protein